jgi:hypothetical protein
LHLKCTHLKLNVKKFHQLVWPFQLEDCAVKVDFCHWIVENYYVRYQHSRNVGILHLHMGYKGMVFHCGTFFFSGDKSSISGLKLASRSVTFFTCCWNIIPQICMQLSFIRVLLYFLLIIHNYILNNLFYGFNMCDLSNL